MFIFYVAIPHTITHTGSTLIAPDLRKMSGTEGNHDDHVLFGAETDDEDEDNKMDHEVEDPGDEEEPAPSVPVQVTHPRTDLAKSKIFKKMLEQSKRRIKTGGQTNEEKAVASWCAKEEESIPVPRPTKKRPRIENKSKYCTSAILVKEDDLEKRADGSKHEGHKIVRDIHVKQTRFFPFFTDAAHGPQGFYSVPTDLVCVWCTEQFDTVPVPLPVSYSKSRDAFRVGGQYCSTQCMMAKAGQCNLRPVAAHMLKSVYKIPFAKTEFYEPAPSPMLLKKFGGVMTIEMFRNTLSIPNIRHREINLPFIPLSAGIEEIQNVRSTIYEYGDEDKVQRVVNAKFNQCRPIHLSTLVSSKMQKTKFASLPTLQEQIIQSERKLRLQREPDTVQKKKRTLKDFMSLRSRDEEK